MTSTARRVAAAVVTDVRSVPELVRTDPVLGAVPWRAVATILVVLLVWATATTAVHASGNPGTDHNPPGAAVEEPSDEPSEAPSEPPTPEPTPTPTPTTAPPTVVALAPADRQRVDAIGTALVVGSGIVVCLNAAVLLAVAFRRG